MGTRLKGKVIWVGWKVGERTVTAHTTKAGLARWLGVDVRKVTEGSIVWDSNSFAWHIAKTNLHSLSRGGKTVNS